MTLPAANVKELTPGELSERSGAAVSALHFYEREGLISSRRTSGNQRRYPRHMLRRVAFIRVSQQVGIPLKEIKAALDSLPQDRAPTKANWARLSARWRDHLDARIDELQRLRDDLTGCIGCGCLSLRTCTLTNPADRLGQTGPGARRLMPKGPLVGPADSPVASPMVDPGAGFTAARTAWLQ
jgi:MerR family redox-sensitive transcriptional activator SoxR